MKKTFKFKLSLILSIGLVWITQNCNADSDMQGTRDFSAYVSKSGEIKLPTDFRRNMVHLGSWLVPEGDASGFHDVYADPDTVDQYRKNNKFRDGAVIVKELRSAESGTYTTGNHVSHATQTIKQWFVMIKDNKNRFPNHKSWGDGWGWALIKTNNPAKNVSTDYKADCQGCHVPAQKTDWIYVDGLLTLTQGK